MAASVVGIVGIGSVAGGPKSEGQKEAPGPRAGLDWWSFQPIARPTVPVPNDAAWRHNPIDAFVKAKLEEKNVLPNPQAEPRVYIRRVTLDLTGLLPTPDEMATYLADVKADERLANEKLVDRLLASDAYGERWGRHWLDVMRFAESNGYETNALRTNAWLYRDYVIRSFNRDTPYPRFILEQLAADTIPDADRTTQAATGFMVAGPHDLVGNATVEGTSQIRSDDLFDMTSTTSTVFLGLTAGCARCHDHKFDPISQRDFYRMQAVFAGVDHADRALTSRDDSDDRDSTVAKIRAEIRDIETQLDENEPIANVADKRAARAPVNVRRNVDRFVPVEAQYVRLSIDATLEGSQPCIDELEIYAAEDCKKNLAIAGTATASSEYPNNPIHKITHLNDGQVGNSHSWISNEAGRGWAQIKLARPAVIDRVIWGRDRDGRYLDRLAVNYSVNVSLDGTTWKMVAGSSDRGTYGAPWQESTAERQKMVARLNVLRGKLSRTDRTQPVYAGSFRGPEPTYLLLRGDVLRKGDEVSPGSIAGIGKPFSLEKGASSAQRRRGLAEWLADASNPLPARVMVNRIWHYHFGQGIVQTPSDFGFNGDRPSHPELLDWLAAEFQSNGWKMKPLHRLIVLSKTYCQSSHIDLEKTKVDAGNRLYWRFPSRRMEAEAIRDSILQVSGVLDRRMGGPGYNLWTYSNYVLAFAPKPKLGPDEFRRMVYQFKPRLQQDGTFGAFDCPDGTGIVPRRSVSTTALQALNLLNDPVLHDQADRFADRLQKQSSEIEEQVRQAFLLILSREPSNKELHAAASLVREHGLSIFCRTMLNCNEFVMME